jgi:serine beta-lactamase-like protein LACTB, mitochondrial
MHPRRDTLAVALVTVALCSTAPAQGAPSRLPDSAVRRADSVIAAYVNRHHVPGLSVAIGLDQRLVWSKAYGLADLEDSIPVTTRSMFRTASIGKPMTATAVMQLWQEGKLDLDTPIQTYCPAFPQKRWPVTARELLAHRSGIRDKTAEEERNYRHYDTIEASVAIFSADSLLFEPRSAFHYSSYNYDVLGCAIEGASGMSYMDYMNRRIFGPAGMSQTLLDDPKAIIPHRVSGYALDDQGKLRNSIHDDMSNRIPAGGFVSTPTDLVRFGIAVLGGRLVADSTRRLMWQVQRGPTDSASNEGYGLGWALGDWYGVQEVMHGGGTPQVCAFLYLLPAKRIVVAFMMNLEAVPDRGDLAGDLVKVVLGPNAPHN